ncbi:clathrin coat assembly protein AP180-like [Rosa rugosa]|uniref:clathrin coat assembly protein AP180-like n=1 Tax=Rosa rugosa TaxID=74645 RepID=UPI002B40B05F|nr:clathrin coat assembly protein AP180-like [Rosa rugosa]
MPSKLKKAIGAVKDQTSISLAKVSNTSNLASLEVTILKATSHDVVPIDDKYVREILSLISASKSNAATCAQAIAKRIGKTRNWIVAIKSLMLVLRIFQDGDPYFPIEVLHGMKRGAKILNLSNFRDDSTSCPWDYTAFVRNFALYLEERLDCFLTGKLQRRFTYQRDQDCIIINNTRNRRRGINNEPVVRDMKPAMLLDRIQFWQKLLDRAIALIPSGAAKTNRLILISLYAIVQETYDLYRDISDGLALLLDSFFHLQYHSCLSAFHACVKASKQFEELSTFYGTCKALGVGRTSEYPSVQKISEELIETLQEFVKDQASFPGRSPPQYMNQNVKDKGTASSPDQFEFANSEPFEGASERGSAFGSACTSLSDLMSVGGIENGASPSWSAEQDFLTSDEQLSEKTLSPFQSPLPEFMVGSNDKASSQSLPQIDLFEVFPPQQTDQVQQANQEGEKPAWELVLFESANQSGAMETSSIASPPPNLFASPSPNLSPNLLESSSSPDLDYFFQNSLTSNALHQNNPFLQDIVQVEGFAIPTSNETSSNAGLENLDDLFSFPSTSQPSAPPTFGVRSSNGSTVAPTFVADSSEQSTMLPTFSSHNSNGSTMAPTFLANNPKQSTMSPTFSAQNSNGRNVAPTYLAQSTKQSTMSPRFSAQNSNERAVAPTFCTADTIDSTVVPTNPKETEIAPTFSAQRGEGSSMSPPLCAQNTNNSITAPTFQAEFPRDRTLALPSCAENLKDTEIAPSFSAQSPEGSSFSPSFCAQNTNNSITAPTFHAEFPKDKTLALSICAENSRESRMSQTFGELTPNNGSVVAPTFSSEEPNEFMAVPTFSARSSTNGNETPRFGSPFAIQSDDPFGPFSGMTSTSETMCNGTVNQETVLHQQRQWLEQQNKIIAKHLT